MSSAGPWSVKGIDPKAREVAKDLARRSGMTLGEWLNQMIIEGGEPEAPPFERPVFERPDEYRRQGGPSLGMRDPFRAGGYHDDNAGEATRVTRALESLSARIEQAEHRSTLAISGIDQSVMGVLARMDGVEREQTALGASFHGSLDEVRATQSKLAERVRRAEQEDGARVESLKALESALARVAAQIYEGESRARAGLSEVRQDLSGMSRRMDQLDVRMDTAEAGSPELVQQVLSRIADRLEAAEHRTSAAFDALQTSFAGLDDRLKTTEARLGPDVEADSPERRFERLAVELSDKVEAARTEMAERLSQAADGKLDQMESALRELAGHVEAAERRSAQAIDRMGREVMKVAQGMGKRVEAVEGRSAAAVEQMGGEMARIADAIESRMRTGEVMQADALEKLGGEISRIAERLAERIAASERRSGQAIEEVGDQVARVTDKINQRYEAAAGDLGERIRQSEERTARLLQEAQDKLDKRLLDAQRRSAIDAAVQAVEGPGARMQPPADLDAGFGQNFVAPAASSADPFPADPFAPPAGEPDALEATGAGMAAAPADDGFGPKGFEDDGFALPEAARREVLDPAVFEEPPFAGPGFAAAALDDGFDEPAAAPRSSTRDLIEAARAAARQAGPSDHRGRRASRGLADGMGLPGSAPAPALDEQDKPSRFGGLTLGRKKKKESSTVRTALLASTTAMALTASVVGAYLLTDETGAQNREPTDARPLDATAENGAAIGESAAAEILAPALTTDAAPAQDAVTPGARPAPVTPVTAAAPAAPAVAQPSVGPSPQLLYSAAVRQIETGDATGLDGLRRAANMGYAPAQFYLAKLHETGTAGVTKDAAEARRWTERAAQAGDAKAMHNLGLYNFDGTGGAKNVVVAATWFKRAAEAGLQDSQYNLARLYEQGYGVAQNSAEAYKWYLIAASGGDAEAKASAERLRAQLSADTQAAAQRTAAAFRTQQTRTAAR